MFMCGIGIFSKNSEDTIRFLSKTEEEIPFTFGEEYKVKNFTTEQSDFFWGMIHDSGIKNAVDITEIQFEEISFIENFGGVYSFNEFHKF